MNYGLYLSASGVLTNLYRQDVYANNLANVETSGFKPDLPTIRQRDPESVEDDLGIEVSQRLLDRLGGGALASPGQIDFPVGPMQYTGRSLDLALPQRDSFFAVQALDAQGKTVERYTRDGQLSMTFDGMLTTVSGQPVLDHEGKTIRVDPQQPLTINGQGDIIQDGDTVASLKVVRVADLSRLVKQGENLYRLDGEGQPQAGRLVQTLEQPELRIGFVEGSAVDPVHALVQLMKTSRAIESNAQLMQYQNQLMNQATTVLGRLA